MTGILSIIKINLMYELNLGQLRFCSIPNDANLSM